LDILNMKNRNFLALTITSIIFPTSSFAIDGFNSCNALLTAGIYNTSQSNSSVDSQSVAKSSFCSADYSKVEKGSSQAASIEASYGMFGGGASGSVSSSQITETQRNVCTSGFNSSAYSSQASNFARNVYQGSLDAWNQCQKLSQQGVNFDLQIDQSMQGATVTLSTTSSGSTVNFNGVDQIGLGRSICTTTRNSNTGSSTGKVLTVDKTTSLKFNSASKLTITCERQMSSDGKGGLFADAQSLVFNTSAGSYQVPMVTIGLSPRVTVDQAVADLQSSVNSQISQVKTDNQNMMTVVSNSIPIGTIVAWHKNIGGTPALPTGWVECNGQTLSDSQSVYNGKAIPNLNGEGRFLRGSSSSGTTQEMDWKSFYVKSEQTTYQHDAFVIPKSGWNTNPGIYGGSWGVGQPNSLSFAFDDSEIRPKNMSVVWIMKVKN
jgi:hypothetical protein